MGCWFGRHKWEELQTAFALGKDDQPTQRIAAVTYICKKCHEMETVRVAR